MLGYKDKVVSSRFAAFKGVFTASNIMLGLFIVAVVWHLMYQRSNMLAAQEAAATAPALSAGSVALPSWRPWTGEDGKFTLYMITYDRDELCKRLIAHYAKCEKVDKIVLSWNNIGRPPPPVYEFETSGKELIIVEETVDSLNNRFRPHPFITTDAVLTIDDDIEIALDILEFAFSVWQQFPTTLIGFSQYVRMHQHVPTFTDCVDKEDKEWHYSAECTGPGGKRTYVGPRPFPIASIALDSAVFFHRRYLELYTNDMAQEVRDYVDEVRNCEDFALPMLVAHYTHLPPVTVDAPGMLHLQEENKKNHHPGLNTMDDHYHKRTRCLNDFEKMFGYMPLQYSNFKLTWFPEKEVL